MEAEAYTSKYFVFLGLALFQLLFGLLSLSHALALFSNSRPQVDALRHLWNSNFIKQLELSQSCVQFGLNGNFNGKKATSFQLRHLCVKRSDCNYFLTFFDRSNCLINKYIAAFKIENGAITVETSGKPIVKFILINKLVKCWQAKQEQCYFKQAKAIQSLSLADNLQMAAIQTPTVLQRCSGSMFMFKEFNSYLKVVISVQVILVFYLLVIFSSFILRIKYSITLKLIDFLINIYPLFTVFALVSAATIKNLEDAIYQIGSGCELSNDFYVSSMQALELQMKGRLADFVVNSLLSVVVVLSLIVNRAVSNYQQPQQTMFKFEFEKSSDQSNEEEQRRRQVQANAPAQQLRVQSLEQQGQTQRVLQAKSRISALKRKYNV